MKLTVTFNDGKKVSAFVSDYALEKMIAQIMEECCYDDESEIDDWDYISTAISEHTYLCIFDKEYDLSDIKSYEVNHKAKETKAQKQKRIMSYLAIYNDALAYAEDFFRYDMLRAFPMQRDGFSMNSTILPITFITDGWEGGNINGLFSVLGHQAVIHVLLQESELTEELKQEIRHEIIHYTLWLAGLPHDDDSAEFWAVAVAYDAMPYDIPSGKAKEYFDAFIKFYRETLEPYDDPFNFIKPLYLADAVRGISSSNTVEEYVGHLAEIANQMNAKNNDLDEDPDEID